MQDFVKIQSYSYKIFRVTCYSLNSPISLHVFDLGKLLNQETKLISWQSDVQL